MRTMPSKHKMLIPLQEILDPALWLQLIIVIIALRGEGAVCDYPCNSQAWYQKPAFFHYAIGPNPAKPMSEWYHSNTPQQSFFLLQVLQMSKYFCFQSEMDLLVKLRKLLGTEQYGKLKSLTGKPRLSQIFKALQLFQSQCCYPQIYFPIESLHSKPSNCINAQCIPKVNYLLKSSQREIKLVLLH